MTQKKKETIKSLAIHEKDVGSSEVQVGLLTDKITRLSEHFKKFKKDTDDKYEVKISITFSFESGTLILSRIRKPYLKLVKSINEKK